MLTYGWMFYVMCVFRIMLLTSKKKETSKKIKQNNNNNNNDDVKCSELGWKCVPLAVKSYGCWGTEARQHMAQFASRLATRYNISKSQAISSLYGRLNLTLLRANVQALLFHPMSFQDTC